MSKISNFLRLNDDLWLVCEHDGTKISFKVDQNELLTLGIHLVDVAINCLRKSKKKEAELADDLLSFAMYQISKAKLKTAQKKDEQ